MSAAPKLPALTPTVLLTLAQRGARERINDGLGCTRAGFPPNWLSTAAAEGRALLEAARTHPNVEVDTTLVRAVARAEKELGS